MIDLINISYLSMIVIMIFGIIMKKEKISLLLSFILLGFLFLGGFL
mgnify:CR=1 FL=1